MLRSLLPRPTAATIEVHDLALALAQASGADFRQSAAQIIHDAAKEVQYLATMYAPIRTGALRSSIVVEFNPVQIEALVYPTARYAKYMEYGTGSRGEFGGSPYVITPKRASRLRFKVGGKVVYAKKVVHPGVSPRPFMRPAAERVIEGLAPDMGQNAVKWIIRTPQT